MKISSNMNLNFGKKAIMTCQIKNAQTKQKSNSTLYKYESNNQKDVREIMFDKQLGHLLPDFSNDTFSHQANIELYALKDDKTQNLIGYALTSRHLRRENADLSGLATVVDEMNANYQYTNSAEPIIAAVAKAAQDRGDASVIIAMRPEDICYIKNIKFSQTKFEEPYLPEKRFNSIIDKATERSQIEFLD